jgi:lysophospholipase L1-like esterase
MVPDHSHKVKFRIFTKKIPVPLFLLLFFILICSSCDQIPTGPELDIVTPTQIDPTEQPPAVDTDQTEVKLEKNDWSNIWIENANQSEKTRILFVGDSISNGYYPLLREDLSADYFLGYYFTSKFLGNPDFKTELTTILDRYDFEIVQINNGLHGWDYSIEKYKQGLEDVKNILDEHAPQALIIWCLTTPVRVEDNLFALDILNQDVIRRNQAALEILGEDEVRINDLYQAMLKHPEYYRDGYHFNDAGKEALAELVVAFILSSR